MTTRNSLQHWLSNVRRSQLFTTVLAVAAVGAFIGASIVMAPGSAETTQVSAGGGTQATGGVATSGSGSVGGAAGAGAGPGGSGAGAAGGAATPGETPGGGPADASSGGAAPEVERVASDRGVTPDTITLGMLIPNIGAVSSLGFSFTDRGDLPEYAQALADYQNSRGGVNGRQVEVVVRSTDPSSTADMDAACQSMLNDARVFGVIDGAMTNGPSQQCISDQGETPYAHVVNWSTDFMNGSGGYAVSYNSAIDRAATTAIRDLVAMGWMDSNSVVGVFGENCPTTGPTFRDVVVPALEGQVRGVELGLVDCTIDAAVTQPPSIATQFRTAGVTHIMILSNWISAQVLMESMARLGSNPKYAATDWWTEVTDSGTKNFNPDQFEGAVGITSFRTGLVNAGLPTYPGVEKCDAAAVEAGLAPVNGGDSELNQYMCELFFIMVRGIEGAGPNPTRDLWRQAIQAIGPYDSFITGPGTFGPGKPDLPTQVYTAIWHRDCRCWRADGTGFRAMAS